MPKSILIPTDFSQNAYNAILYAFELFREQECDFHIYHTYYLDGSTRGNPLFPIPDSLEYNNAENQVRVKMDLLKNSVSTLSNTEKHRLHFNSDYGFFLDLMNLKVQKENIDLIIMGSRGATDDKKIVYGRNTIDVMEKVRDCPVLGIPKNVNLKNLNEIVFPTDFKGKWNVKEMDVLLDILKITNSQLRVFHVGNEADLNQTQLENKKLLETQFSSCEHSFHWMQDVPLDDGLLAFVEKHNSGMIAFVNRKHRFFGTIFSNPLIIKLGLQTTIPMLALHDSK